MLLKLHFSYGSVQTSFQHFRVKEESFGNYPLHKSLSFSITEVNCQFHLHQGLTAYNKSYAKGCILFLWSA